MKVSYESFIIDIPLAKINRKVTNLVRHFLLTSAEQKSKEGLS